MRRAFVESTLNRLIGLKILSKMHTVLVIAGDHSERAVFQSLGFESVVISNLDERLTSDSFAPYHWQLENAQNLSFDDASFDFIFVSDALHHCSSPHAALLEMYRVCKTGIIVFESRDSLLMRLAEKLKITPRYEVQAVLDNQLQYGGVDNSDIPNFIYRWTENEFKKTINAYHPMGENTFHFFYGLNLPNVTGGWQKHGVKYWVVRLLGPLLKLGSRCFKRQCNSFCMVALKPHPETALWPWLTITESGKPRFNKGYTIR